MIYIATTPNLKKRNIYKVGMTTDIISRMKALNGYASRFDDMWFAEYIYEIPASFNTSDNIAVDKYFHKWLNDNYHISTLTSDELNTLLKSKISVQRSERELYCGISASDLYNLINECFTGNPTIHIPCTDWSTHAKTSSNVAQYAVLKLKSLNSRFFDTNYCKKKVCDISCRDEVIVCTLLSTFFKYSFKYFKNDSIKCIKYIMHNCIYAFCLRETFDIVKHNILMYITGHSEVFGYINRKDLEEINIFKNFQIKYSEDYYSDTTMDIINEASHKKFDAIVINPPYATTGGGTLHLQFVSAALKMSDKVVAIFPFDFIYRDKKVYKKFKTIFDSRLVSVEERTSEDFEGTYMKTVGIYDFEKSNNGKITITDVSEIPVVHNTLIGISRISNTEQPIFNILSSHPSVTVVSIGSNDFRGVAKQHPELNVETDKLELQHLAIKESCKELKPLLTEGKYALIVNRCNNKRNGTSFTKKNGQILNKYEDVENLLIETNTTTGFNAIVVNTKNAAENLKRALERDLLRFAIYRSQIDQQMYKDSYKYIPDINWASSKVKTDKGILEMLGCNSNDAETYIEYIGNIIYRVDHGERP